MKLILLILTVYLTFISSAFSYVGPGMGAGIISIIIGFLVCILGIFVAIVWLPLKKIILKIKNSKKEKDINNKDIDS